MLSAAVVDQVTLESLTSYMKYEVRLRVYNRAVEQFVDALVEFTTKSSGTYQPVAFVGDSAAL